MYSASFFLVVLLVVVATLQQLGSAEIKVIKKCASKNLKQVNKHRKANGLKKLKMDNDARAKAELHSKRMLQADKLYHSKPIFFKDYENVAYNWMSEATKKKEKGMGKKLFKQWKKSPGHNQNMLRADAKFAGIACVYDDAKGPPHKVFATQIFWRKQHGPN